MLFLCFNFATVMDAPASGVCIPARPSSVLITCIAFDDDCIVLLLITFT